MRAIHMKKIIGLLFICLSVVGCTSHKYDAHVVALPASAGASGWVAIRVDRQTGECWYWDAQVPGASKPQWHRISDPSEPAAK